MMFCCHNLTQPWSPRTIHQVRNSMQHTGQYLWDVDIGNGEQPPSHGECRHQSTRDEHPRPLLQPKQELQQQAGPHKVPCHKASEGHHFNQGDNDLHERAILAAEKVWEGEKAHAVDVA